MVFVRGHSFLEAWWGVRLCGRRGTVCVLGYIEFVVVADGFFIEEGEEGSGALFVLSYHELNSNYIRLIAHYSYCLSTDSYESDPSTDL